MIFLLVPLIFITLSNLIPQIGFVFSTLSCLFLMVEICINGVQKSLIVYLINSILLVLIFKFNSSTLLFIFLFGFYAFFKYFLEKKTLRLGDETLIKLIYFNISILFLFNHLNLFIFNKIEIRYPVFAIILYNIVFILIDLLLTYSLTYIEKYIKK